MEVTSRTLKVQPRMGMKSLIGVLSPAPVGWGNYFWLQSPDVKVLNFWAENLEAAVPLFLEDGRVQITMWEWKDGDKSGSCCIIDDPRIPPEWYHNKLCFTGGGCPMEVAQEIYAIVGDPTNELERFTDPGMYYARKCQRYVTTEQGYSFVKVDAEDKGKDLVAELLAKRAEVQNG